MAYNNVGTPVFYVDNYLYLRTIGANPTSIGAMELGGVNVGLNSPTNVGGLYTLKPNKIKRLKYGTPGMKFIHIPSTDQDFPLQTAAEENIKWYYAILNHNLGGVGIGFGKVFGDGTNAQAIPIQDPVYNATNQSGVIEFEDESTMYEVPNSGSSIYVTSDSPYDETSNEIIIRVGTNDGDVIPYIGAVSAGLQYTMPHSPDLRLSTQIIMDGANSMRTSNGGAIINLKHTGNPLWYGSPSPQQGDLEGGVSIGYQSVTNPFDTFSADEPLNALDSGRIRNGRMSWDLKFSYIDDHDLFPANQKASTNTEHPSGEYEATDIDGNDNFSTDISTDDSFVSMVWNRTIGGALPFIFQPDSNNRDNFYICRFKQNSLRVTQLAYKTYGMSVIIEETW